MTRSTIMWRALLAITIILGASVTAHARTFDVSLTRLGNNFYKVDGKGVYALTRNCYVYANGSRAALSDRQVEFELFGICFVAAILADADIRPGKYRVTATRKTDNLYFVGNDTYVVTSYCYQRADRVNAVLELRYNGKGTLSFREPDKTCQVEAPLIPIRLR